MSTSTGSPAASRSWISDQASTYMTPIQSSPSSFPRPLLPAKAGRGSTVFAKTTLDPRRLGHDGEVRHVRRRLTLARRPRAAGFSLLEVLVAFVVLALVGTALFRLFSAALGNAAAADDYSRATLYAESRLASIGVEAALREGADQGTSEDGRYAWAVKIEPYTPPGTTPDLERVGATLPVQLWRIAVTVTWPGTFGNVRTIQLSTVRLAVKEL